jgi:DNA-binding transcriptional regulator GbsR (MarR family)
MHITETKKRLVEKLGVFFEGHGKSPAEARIISLFLVADQTELTFEEIQQSLSISKSAVSNAINLLLLTEEVEYVTKPGDRRKYYKSKIEQWMTHVEQHIEKSVAGKVLLKEVLEQRIKTTKMFNAALKDMIDFMDFVQSQHKELFAKWKKSRNKS